jgi:hypothetical protein
MNYRKHGMRALGLSFIAVLGLMAFMAAGAQGAFLYLEKVGEKIELKTLAVESEPVISAHTTGTLLVTAKNIEFQCPKVESDPAAPVKLLGNSTVAHGHLIFSGCEAFEIENKVTKVKLTLLKNCVPHSPGQLEGKILAGGLAELVLHPANNTMVLFSPLTEINKEGKKITLPFTTVEVPEACALTETSPVTGTLLAECGELNGSSVFVGGSCATHRKVQLLQSVSQKLGEELGDTLKFGANIAAIDGIAAVEFGAPCKGCSWGGDAA